VTQDDWYKGYFIPKDTIIMMNIWAMHYNAEEFPEPKKVSLPQVLANNHSGYPIDISIMNSLQESTLRSLT